LGLKKRIEHTRAAAVVVGLSGGLDSTLAVLITAVAMRLLDRPASDIIAVTMPCFGTTDRTRDNAVELAGRLGATLKRIDISEAVKRHFKDIGQSMEDHDVTFENGQARERTQVLMDIANQVGGMVVGTGDLSELALGWATYNGDHMSMYGLNASIPKTLVRHLVIYVCGDRPRASPNSLTWRRTSWTPPSPPSCSPPSTARFPRRPRTWWAPTSSMTSSSITPSAGASRPKKCCGWPSTPLVGPMTGPPSSVGEDLLPSLLRSAVQALVSAGRTQGGSVTLSPGATGACRRMRWPLCGWTNWKRLA
jgi:hypothetical protein